MAVVDVVCVVMTSVMRDNIRRIPMHDVVVVAAYDVAVRISNYVVMMINVIAWTVVIVA